MSNDPTPVVARPGAAAARPAPGQTGETVERKPGPIVDDGVSGFAEDGSEFPPNIDEYRSVAADRSRADAERARAIKALITYGYVAEAAAALEGFVQPHVLHTQLSLVTRGERYRREAAAAALGADADPFDPASPYPDDAQAIQILPHPASDVAVVIFAGRGRAFWSIPRLPRLLPGRSCHTVMLRDPDACFYMAGLKGLGADYDQCLATLRRVLQNLKAREIYCIGNSIGGFGALRFGLDLGARRVMSFSAPPTLDVRSEPGADLRRYPVLVRLYRKAPDAAVDLAPLYRDHPNPPEAFLYYGTGHRRDVFWAQMMDGIRNVHLVPVTGFSGHRTCGEIVRRGEFEPVLRDFFAK